jgi:hypothetical protein
MIAAKIDEARKILVDLVGLNDLSPLGDEAAAMCRSLMETVADPEFPGALVPSVSAAGALSILVATPTMATWRQLSPVLRAFAGPTLTSFDGLAQALPQGDPTVNVVARSQPTATGVISLPHDERARFMALRAMSRARDTLARAPNLQRAAPEPTSWLLARFQDCLNVGRREAATDILARLKSELRLDALNLKFLEVQLLAAFGDWLSIVELTGFANLCVARRTPVITALLLEALYQVYLANPFDAGAADETRAQFETTVRPHAQPMLRVPVSPALTTPGWRIYGLEAWVAPSRTDIGAVVADRLDELGWLAGHLAIATHVEETPSSAALAPLDDARAALLRVDADESIDSLTAALAALGKLSPEELTRLRDAEPFRATLHVTEEAAGDGLPTSWNEWLAKAADPSFSAALEIARRGKDDWSIGVTTGDPIAVQALVSALEQAFGLDLAAERTAQALPFLVAWLRRDPDFPCAAMAPVYASLLTLFALSSTRGRVTYESSQILVNALLTVGMDSKAYHALIADIEELGGDGFGVSMVYWMLEIVEDFMRASTPDAGARERFLHSALARISPIYTRLTSLQRAATARLANELGWTLQSLGINGEASRADDFASRIRGLRIAIYSLTESSSRQAKIAIEEVEATAIVDCNADHGGTARLKALAEGADLFVMAWLSAKHAATDFIREHRANRPLLYAQGRGFSSILRALEDHFSNSSH